MAQRELVLSLVNEELESEGPANNVTTLDVSDVVEEADDDDEVEQAPANRQLAVIQLRKVAGARPPAVVERVRVSAQAANDVRRENDGPLTFDTPSKIQRPPALSAVASPPPFNKDEPLPESNAQEAVLSPWTAPPVPLGRRAEPIAKHLKVAQDQIIRRRTWLWSLLLATLAGVAAWHGLGQ